MKLDLARRRLTQQHLAGPPCERPEHVVEHLLAVQAQDFAGAKWALAQRTADGTDALVQRAFDEGRILRTHVLRPTWHFVTPADIRWLLELSAPRVHAASAYYYRQLGIDAAFAKRSKARIARVLARGEHLTREELGHALGERDEALSGNRLAHVLMWAELDGLICSGVMRGKRHTYALLDERARRAPPLDRDEALARIAQRYVDGHGPAQARDLAWWAGLTLADARRGFDACGDRLERTTLGDATYWLAPEPSTAPKPWRRRGPLVHLLPNYDELLMAFDDRSAMVDPGIAPKTSELSAHFVVSNGRLIGGWKRTVGRSEVQVEARLLREPTPGERRALDAAAWRYAQSLGLGLRLELTLVG
ncbi:MAG TPA: winged helix DNA-binding domain-containing protein [Polyangiaceae bacterium]|nr:winged helix DNA-binding domain-containing protein [Polyangiaceae bacterium]